MAKYKVVTIAMAVKNNRIAKFGETVEDSELTVNVDQLIEAGFIELIEKEAKAEKSSKVQTKAPSAAEKVATSDDSAEKK